jgi:hypothetical protein
VSHEYDDGELAEDLRKYRASRQWMEAQLDRTRFTSRIEQCSQVLTPCLLGKIARRRNAAACLIQAVFRGWLVRRHFSLSNINRNRLLKSDAESEAEDDEGLDYEVWVTSRSSPFGVSPRATPRLTPTLPCSCAPTPHGKEGRKKKQRRSSHRSQDGDDF